MWGVRYRSANFWGGKGVRQKAYHFTRDGGRLQVKSTAESRECARFRQNLTGTLKGVEFRECRVVERSLPPSHSCTLSFSLSLSLGHTHFLSLVVSLSLSCTHIHKDGGLYSGGEDVQEQRDRWGMLSQSVFILQLSSQLGTFKTLRASFWPYP